MKRVLPAAAMAAWLGIAAGTALAASPTTITIPGDHVYPESITSTADGTIYIGSMAEGVVLRVPPGSDTAQPFIAAGSNGTLSVLGVLADEKAGTLWVCSSDLSAMGVVMTHGEKPGALKAFDLKTGAPKASYKLPGDRTLCNDAVVAPDGTLYVTDSFQPHILALAPGAKELTVWVEDPRFHVEGGAGLDGIALAGDGSVLVNTYNGGALFHVARDADGKAGAVTTVKTSRPIKLADALRTIGPDTFLMIEGTGSLDRITLKGEDTAQVDTIKDGFKLPVSVTVVGSTAWVAEGQLNHVFEPQTGAPDPFKAYAVSFEK